MWGNKSHQEGGINDISREKPSALAGIRQLAVKQNSNSNAGVCSDCDESRLISGEPVEVLNA